MSEQGEWQLPFNFRHFALMHVDREQRPSKLQKVFRPQLLHLDHERLIFLARSAIGPQIHLSGSLEVALATLGFHVLRPYGLLADNPSKEGLWFAGRVVEGDAYGPKASHQP